MCKLLQLFFQSPSLLVSDLRALLVLRKELNHKWDSKCNICK